MMETLRDALARLERAGYSHSFRAVTDGLLDISTGRRLPPEELVVDEVTRFEGDSDPDEEAAVLALRSRNGDVAGTYVVVYGPAMPPEDAQMVERLGG